MTKNLKFFLFSLVLSLGFFGGVNIFQKKLENFLYLSAAPSHANLALANILSSLQIPKPDIAAKSAISVKIFKNGKEKILFGKNIDDLFPIASLTKLMTAAAVFESGASSGLGEKKIAVSREAAGQGDVPHYGNLRAGEKFTFRELLDLMLVYSSNDAAFALAQIVRADNIVGDMQNKASELGLKNTFFYTTTGLDVENGINISTSREMAKMARYVLEKHPQIFEISRQNPKVSFENGISGIKLGEGMRAVGGKTGETKSAGGCLVFVLKDAAGNFYINVVLGSADAFSRIADMNKIIEWLEKEIKKNSPGANESFKPDPAELAWKEVQQGLPWSARDSHAVLVYQDRLWLMGGLDGNGYVIGNGAVEYWKAPHKSDIWVSEDGEKWELVLEKAPWGQRRSLQVVDFKGKMWLLGGWGPVVGYKNDVWVSENGKDWELVLENGPWSKREGHQVVVFGNKLWLIGGVNYDSHETMNDVWYSENGIDWFEATNSAPWISRWDHAVTVFNGKMWLSGGMDLKKRVFNDVWRSEDGINWTLATANPPWSARQGHVMLEYKNNLWILGRFNDVSNGGPNDVWHSEDGIVWEKTEADPEWLGREDHAAVVFKDKIWVIGGMASDWTWKNDIWHSSF